MKIFLAVLALACAVGRMHAVETDTPPSLYVAFEEAVEGTEEGMLEDAETKYVSGIALYDKQVNNSYQRREQFIETAVWPYYFMVNKAGDKIYTLEESEDVGDIFNLTVYHKDKTLQKFVPKSTVNTKKDLYYMALDDSEQCIVSADFITGSVLLIHLLDDGTWTTADTYTVPDAEKGNTSYPIKVDFTPIQKDLVGVAYAGWDKISFFKVDADHKLQTTGLEAVTANGSYPTTFAFSKTGNIMYVLGLKSATITPFDVKYEADAKTIKEFIKKKDVPSLPEGIAGAVKNYDYYVEEGGDARLQIHPTGKFLFAMHVQKQYVACYQIDDATGELTTLIEFLKLKGEGAFGMTLTTEGDRLIIGDVINDVVEIYDVSPTDGKLTYVTPDTKLGGAGYVLDP